MTEEADEIQTAPRKVFWAGRQWCVTDYGLETIRENLYYVEAGLLRRLTDYDEAEERPVAETLRHISRKTWVDIEDLFAGFSVAVAIHNITMPPGAVSNAIIDARDARERDMICSRLGSQRLAELKAAGNSAPELTTRERFRLSELADEQVNAEIEGGRNFLEVTAPAPSDDQLIDDEDEE